MNELSYADERVQEALAHHCERLTDDGLELEERQLSVQAVRELGRVYTDRMSTDIEAETKRAEIEEEAKTSWVDVAIEVGKIGLGICQVLATVSMFNRSINMDNQRFDIMMDYQSDGSVVRKMTGAKTEIGTAESKLKTFRVK